MAEMSEAELNDLENKAKRANIGEWWVDHGPSGIITVKVEGKWLPVADSVWDDDDREHIIAFQPSVALRLIAELRDLRTKVERLEGVVAETIERGEVSDA